MISLSLWLKLRWKIVKDIFKGEIDMSLIEKISKIDDLGYIDGCSETQIKDAEKKLGMIFPTEYVEYVKTYGCIDFGATEWTGLNIDGELNTVEATLAEKKYNNDFPEKYFVLDDYHIDGKKIIVNEAGEVYLLQFDVLKKVCNSISEYLDICIRNNS